MVFLDILESSRIHARKGLWKPGEGPSPCTRGKGDTPSRERPFAAPEMSKNADIKKDSLALYGLPEAHKTRHIKKISLPRYPPTLRRPRETHRRPAWGVMYKNRAILRERGAPLPAGSWVITTGTGVGKYFQLWRSDRAGEPLPLQKEKGRGTMSTTPWGLPLCFGLAAGARAFFIPR